jgi:hypothetical protein
MLSAVISNAILIIKNIVFKEVCCVAITSPDNYAVNVLVVIGKVIRCVNVHYSSSDQSIITWAIKAKIPSTIVTALQNKIASSNPL